jgi:N-succinyldiaminopimelate aminotransferase
MRNCVADRMSSPKASVFDEMNELARRYDAVNLGSGTPNRELPEPMRLAASEATARGHNQYSPIQGEAVLRAAVVAHAARFYDHEIDPAEISITCGVTEAMHAAITCFVNPQDEVIVFEPFYECYLPAIQLAGGIPVGVTLHPPTFRFDPLELRRAFSSRTKAIIVNTPHNPSGTVFSPEEFGIIADLCKQFDVLAITDEVYEHIVFDNDKHIRLATLPGMRERTLTLSGAGKTFSCTGWRIGWAIGPAIMQDALRRLRQLTVYAAPTPLQLAVAAGLGLPDSYYGQLAADYKDRRNLLLSALTDCGLSPNKPAGGFFALTEVSSLGIGDGRAFCHGLAKDLGVVAIPTDTFYLSPSAGKRIVRFTFSVRPALLEEAAKRLAPLASRREGGARPR